MLKEKLQKVMEATAAKLSPEIKSVIMAGTQAVADSIEGRKIPAVGEALPEFVLPDSAGNAVSSKELVDNRQLILTFFRGSW